MAVRCPVTNLAQHCTVAHRRGPQPLERHKRAAVRALSSQGRHTVEGPAELKLHALIVDAEVGFPFEECWVVAAQRLGNLAQAQLVVSRTVVLARV
eukprot:CAMPEP_0171141272 /NCGR_PEP_ID=MMETSP0766_2-20121228/140365_1 /TAXON_ID=439317 /ORGANISM="Gambierdiscus australes, Strain CAWD 149" /LENGTH=95 /DNA_ID=CAMNT_0011604995 /DNA_START=268 /DNA_END=555 /DNA_ORIENTATION=+